jgi:hypothetical protein
VKAIDMTEKAERGFAELMVRGLGEIGGRSADDLTSLETLAVVSVRMLVGAGALSMPKLAELGVKYVSELDGSTPRSIVPLRENLGLAFNNEAELNATGITFHTVQ